MRHFLFKASLVLVVFTSQCTAIYAQIPNNELTAYQQALEDIYVLSNHKQQIPIKDLDTLRPALLNIGVENLDELWKTFNTYIPTARIEYKNEAFITEWPPYMKATPQPNMLFIALGAKALENNNIPWANLLNTSNRPIVLLLFGEHELTQQLRPSTEDIIYSRYDTPWAQSLVAQIVFGARACNNTLKQNLNAFIKTGTGLSTKALDRLAFAPPAALGMNAQLLQDSIASIIQEGLDHQAFPGAQILVAKSGTVVYHQAFGYHTFEDKKKVELTDIYDLASVTKISSALAALMQWHGQGDFDLDASLQTYYPKAKASNKASLSFRSMLAHQARLRPWIPYWQNTLKGNGRYPWSKARDAERINDYRFKRKTFARDSSEHYPIYITDDLWQHKDYEDKMVKAILKSPLNKKEGYRYSGLLFYLLPDIVKNKTGQSLEAYLQINFYRPLGAYTMGYNPLNRLNKQSIIPTERDTFFRMTQLHGYVHDEGAAMMGGVSCNAGLFANAYDLAKLQQMYLNFGRYGGKQYISSSSVKEFTRYQYADQDNRRGLGFDKPLLKYDAQASSVAQAASANSFGHAGYTGTFTWADPDKELLFIFLSNRVYPSRTNRGTYIHNIRPRIHTAIYQALN